MREIPEVELSRARILLENPVKLKELKSFTVLLNGDYLCTVIIPRHYHLESQAEYLALQSNTIGGIDPNFTEPVKPVPLAIFKQPEEEIYKCPECRREFSKERALSVHRRRHNKVKVEV